MTDKFTLNMADIRRAALADLQEHGPDFVYTAPESGDGSCMYADPETGEPSCLVGRILAVVNFEAFQHVADTEAALGPTAIRDFFQPYDGSLVGDDETDTDHLMLMLQNAQKAQDDGQPLAKAVSYITEEGPNE